MRKNKGFTYYELLIVIAIMSMMVGFMSIGIGTVYRNNVNRMADDIESSLKAARNNAITKGSENGWANFYYLNKTLYVYVGKEITVINPVDFDTQKWEKIGNGFDSISVDTVTMTNGSVASFGFKQSTGEFRGLDWPLGGSPALHCYDITIKVHKGNSTSKVVVDTFGKVDIN